MGPGSRGTYHVISRCTRREFLLGGVYEHRREWAAELLAELLGGFAIDVHAYALMSNHVHLILRPRPDVVAGWSEERVARRGLTHFPLRVGVGISTVPVTAALVQETAGQAHHIERYRQRLSSITWLMRLFKQRLARRANREDGVTGHFWESRFSAVPLLDNGAVYACMAYVDRNPLRAGMARRPEDARYCSIARRLVQAGLAAEPAGVGKAERALGKRLTGISNCRPVDSWTGEIAESGLSLKEYVTLVAPSPSATVDGVCAKLGLDPALWQERSTEPGLFQGVGAGRRSARQAFAATQGKKTLADKTGIWLER